METSMDQEAVATLRSDMDTLRSDMERRFNKVDGEIKDSHSSLIRWMVGLFAGFFTLTIGSLVMVATIMAGYANWLFQLWSNLPPG